MVALTFSNIMTPCEPPGTPLGPKKPTWGPCYMGGV